MTHQIIGRIDIATYHIIYESYQYNYLENAWKD